MEEYIEYEGRHNAYYKEALTDSYDRYRDMSKEELTYELGEVRERNKGLGTNISIADCMIIYKLLEQKEALCLKD